MTDDNKMTREELLSYPEGWEAVCDKMLDFLPEDKTVRNAWLESFFKTIIKR